MATLRIELSPEFRRTVAKLKRADNSTALRRDLVSALKGAARPAAAAARVRVRNLPISGPGGGGGDRDSPATRLRGRGLRRRVASLVDVRVRTTRNPTVQIYVAAHRMPDRQKALPRHLDSPRGWRHPVFGNRAVWVAQVGGPWFAVSVRPFEPEIRFAVERAMREHLRGLG